MNKNSNTKLVTIRIRGLKARKDHDEMRQGVGHVASRTFSLPELKRLQIPLFDKRKIYICIAREQIDVLENHDLHLETRKEEDKNSRSEKGRKTTSILPPRTFSYKVQKKTKGRRFKGPKEGIYVPQL